jgi:hypothetical protein
LQNFSVELFHERAGRLQNRKTPPIIDLAFSNNSPSIPLNFPRSVKAHHPAVHSDVQFIINDEKLDDDFVAAKTVIERTEQRFDIKLGLMSWPSFSAGPAELLTPAPATRPPDLGQ